MSTNGKLLLSSKIIGLFGTCGGSKWRDSFMALLSQHDIPYFNPQVDNWTPECAANEAWHLANDRLILFPVTAETFGFGSLAESGFSIQTALLANASRFVLIYIAPDVDDKLKNESSELADASRRARTLAIAHLSHVTNPNVFIATSMEDMLAKVLKIYAAIDLLDQVRIDSTWRSALSPETWLDIVTQKKEIDYRERAVIEYRPNFTVLYNIVSAESSEWIGTGWEFFYSEDQAKVCYDKHCNNGNCPTMRPYNEQCDFSHLGAIHSILHQYPTPKTIKEIQ